MNDKVDTCRRTLLAALGLSSAAAVGMETFLPAPARAGGVQSGRASGPQLAAALRKFAELIETGRAEVETINIHSEISPDKIAGHDLQVRFVYHPELDA